MNIVTVSKISNFIKFLAFSYGLVLTTPAMAKDLSPQDTIKAVQVAMWDAIEKGDLDRYATFIHPKFSAFHETATKITRGKDKEIAGIKRWMGMATDIKTQMHDADVTVVGDMAVLSYIWTDTSIENGKPSATTGKSTRVFKRENGKWLCIHAHYTYIPSPRAHTKAPESK